MVDLVQLLDKCLQNKKSPIMFHRTIIVDSRSMKFLWENFQESFDDHVLKII